MIERDGEIIGEWIELRERENALADINNRNTTEAETSRLAAGASLLSPQGLSDLVGREKSVGG